MHSVIPIDPARVSIPPDRAPTDPETVEALRVSMAEVGLWNPIIVQRQKGLPWRFLVAGRHRLEAARALNWKEISAFELPERGEDDDAAKLGRMVEVAENLHRREIKSLDRDLLSAEWFRLLEERRKQAQGVSRQVAAKPSGGRPSGGVRQAARSLNVSEKALRRSLQVAKLSPEAQEAARAHGLDDNQSALLEAAKAPTPEAQVEVLRRRHEPEQPSSPPPMEAPTAQLFSAWSAANVEAQNEFLGSEEVRLRLLKLAGSMRSPNLRLLRITWFRASARIRAKFLAEIGASNATAK